MGKEEARVTGVHFVYDGVEHFVKAGREVILSAGQSHLPFLPESQSLIIRQAFLRRHRFLNYPVCPFA